MPAVNLWARGEKKARVSFEEIGLGLTPYPNLRIFPQDEHEKLLLARLAAMSGGPNSLVKQTTATGSSRGFAMPTAATRHAKPPTSPAATARAPWCAKRWASDWSPGPETSRAGPKNSPIKPIGGSYPEHVTTIALLRAESE